MVAGGIGQFHVYSCRVKTYFVYVIKPCSDIQVYSRDLCNSEIYSSLKCLLLLRWSV